MPEPLPPQILAWLRQSAAVDGAAYSQVLLYLLERVEALERRPIPGFVDLATPTPEAAPVLAWAEGDWFDDIKDSDGNSAFPTDEELERFPEEIRGSERVTYSPTAWRLARRNGELILQAGSLWVQGIDSGTEWNDVPTVNLDEQEVSQ
jgi:hypothetical protein